MQRDAPPQPISAARFMISSGNLQRRVAACLTIDGLASRDFEPRIIVVLWRPGFAFVDVRYASPIIYADEQAAWPWMHCECCQHFMGNSWASLKTNQANSLIFGWAVEGSNL
jgi:hypothetical protein